MDLPRDLLNYILIFVKEKLLGPFLDSGEGDRRCKECGSILKSSEGELVCSERCLQNLWVSVRESYAKQSGKSICLLPGCEMPCYREGDRVHDYCGRSHSESHMQQIRALYGCYINVKQCQLPDCKKFCFVNDYGVTHDYCSKTHAEMHRQMTPIRDYSKGSGPIRFYNKHEAFYEFTNFYKFAPFDLDGKKWPSTEHYFQSQKFVGTPYEEYIRLYASSPHDAFKLARDPESLKWQRSDWGSVKLDVMYKALLAKFTEHDRLRQLLLSTGDRRLVEHTFDDSFWGDGGAGSGLNHLGKLLEKVRGLIKDKPSTKK